MCFPFPSPQDSLERSTAVFTGKVINIDIANEIIISSADPVLVTFNVSEIWKGPDHKTLVVTTARYEASCGYSFEQGGEYIVYAYGEEDKLSIHMCLRTELIANAREDLQALGKGNIPTNSGSNINVGFARTTAHKPVNTLESRYVWAERCWNEPDFQFVAIEFWWILLRPG